ncbi:MAG: DUF4426 domain-containing protein [Pseudohongiellaceae bacterium]
MLSSLKKISFWFIVSFGIFSSILQAEQSQNINDYTVHYIAVNSNFISPEIAERYGIIRSTRNAFLNISVIKNTSDLGTPRCRTNNRRES